MRYPSLFFVLLFCGYFCYYISTYTDWHFIDNVNLIFHEAGHSIFFFLGEFFQILAGSLFQVSLPLIISVYFFLHNQKISGLLCLLWVGQNLLNVSIYVKDAIIMELPLLGGGDSIHDWNYILDKFGILKYTYTIASTVYTIGVMTIILGAIMAVYYNSILDKEIKN